MTCILKINKKYNKINHNKVSSNSTFLNLIKNRLYKFNLIRKIIMQIIMANNKNNLKSKIKLLLKIKIFKKISFQVQDNFKNLNKFHICNTI